MYKLKMWFMRFMSGRYGSDDLNKGLFWLYFILLILNLFIRSGIISILEWVIVILYFFRMLSRNIPKRQSENYKYLTLKNKVSSFFRDSKKRFADRKTHVYRKCPNCGAKLRLPKRKGEHTCCCPRCRKDFRVKIR